MVVAGHTCGRPSKVGGGKLFSKKSWNALRILQVEWHPYSDTHLGVLSTDGVLRLVVMLLLFSHSTVCMAHAVV